MKLWMTVAAFACDIVGTALVLIDVVVSRRNRAKLSAVQAHITNLDVLSHKTKRMSPAQPGETVHGMDVAEIFEIMQGGVDDATALSKETLLEISREIERIEWLPLGLIATIILLAGIALHATAEFMKE